MTQKPPTTADIKSATANVNELASDAERLESMVAAAREHVHAARRSGETDALRQAAKEMAGLQTVLDDVRADLQAGRDNLAALEQARDRARTERELEQLVEQASDLTNRVHREHEHAIAAVLRHMAASARLRRERVTVITTARSLAESLGRSPREFSTADVRVHHDGLPRDLADLEQALHRVEHLIHAADHTRGPDKRWNQNIQRAVAVAEQQHAAV